MDGKMINNILEWFRWRFKRIPDNLKISENNLIIKKRKPIRCQFRGCQEKISIMSYNCHYCGKIHCDKHRIPEDHKCLNPKLPYSMKLKASSVYYRHG